LPTEAIAPTETLIANGPTLLEDDFSVSRNGWGTLDSSTSSVQYENDTLHMQLFEKNYVTWSRPNDEDYENVHVEITAINNNTDSETAFGIVCLQQSEDWSFYYLAMTPGGQYAIIKATDGQDDEILTNDGEWDYSDAIPVDAASYQIGADCSGGTLILYVDGKQIASVNDSSYSSGHIGLFTWSAEDIASADVSFDDFVLSSLE
jgi:hypothetical protein